MTVTELREYKDNEVCYDEMHHSTLTFTNTEDIVDYYKWKVENNTEMLNRNIKFSTFDSNSSRKQHKDQSV